MKQQIAIYLRLSLEDVDKRTNKVKDESNSIASQRMLCLLYTSINAEEISNLLIGVPCTGQGSPFFIQRDHFACNPQAVCDLLLG